MGNKLYYGILFTLLGSFMGFGFLFWIKIILPNTNTLFLVWYAHLISTASGLLFADDIKDFKTSKGSYKKPKIKWDI